MLTSQSVLTFENIIHFKNKSAPIVWIRTHKSAVPPDFADPGGDGAARFRDGSP